MPSLQRYLGYADVLHRGLKDVHQCARFSVGLVSVANFAQPIDDVVVEVYSFVFDDADSCGWRLLEDCSSYAIRHCDVEDNRLLIDMSPCEQRPLSVQGDVAFVIRLAGQRNVSCRYFFHTSMIRPEHTFFVTLEKSDFDIDRDAAPHIPADLSVQVVLSDASAAPSLFSILPAPPPIPVAWPCASREQFSLFHTIQVDAALRQELVDGGFESADASVSLQICQNNPFKAFDHACRHFPMSEKSQYRWTNLMLPREQHGSGSTSGDTASETSSRWQSSSAASTSAPSQELQAAVGTAAMVRNKTSESVQLVTGVMTVHDATLNVAGKHGIELRPLPAIRSMPRQRRRHSFSVALRAKVDGGSSLAIRTTPQASPQQSPRQPQSACGDEDRAVPGAADAGDPIAAARNPQDPVQPFMLDDAQGPVLASTEQDASCVVPQPGDSDTATPPSAEAAKALKGKGKGPAQPKGKGGGDGEGPPSAGGGKGPGKIPARGKGKAKGASGSSNPLPLGRKFHWKPLADNSLENTVWAEINVREDTVAESTDTTIEGIASSAADQVAVLERLFKQKSAAEMAAPVARRKALASEQVKILDDRRAQNIAIVMTGLGFDKDELCSRFKTLQTNGINADSLDKCQEVLPTEEESKKLLAYRGDPAALRDFERRLLDLCFLNRLPQRLQMMSFAVQLRSTVGEVTEEINTLANAARQVRASKQLRTILREVLFLGNFVNHGLTKKSSFATKGFSVESLPRLRELKSQAHTSVTLLHCVTYKVLADATAVVEPAPEPEANEALPCSERPRIFREEISARAVAVLLREELSLVGPAARMSIESVRSWQEDWAGQLRTVAGELKLSSKYEPEAIAAMKQLHKNAEQQLDELTVQFSACEKELTDLVHFFGEDPKKTTASGLLTALKEFIDQFSKAADEILRQPAKYHLLLQTGSDKGNESATDGQSFRRRRKTEGHRVGAKFGMTRETEVVEDSARRQARKSVGAIPLSQVLDRSKVDGTNSEEDRIGGSSLLPVVEVSSAQPTPRDPE